jgi:hypothetical protein
MDYNLTEKHKEVITWLVEANRRGELADEFSVAWYTGGGQLLGGRSGVAPSEEEPEITRGVLDALESEGLILQEIRYQTRTRRTGTKRQRTTEKQSETSRRCTLTQKAYDAVDSGFVLPDPQPTSANFHFHGDVTQSIIGTQNRAELTNNLDLRAVEQRIDQEGGADAEELRQALAEVRRLLESGDRIDRGALSRFSETMQRHEWFTGSVMQALLGFATQAGG